MQNEKEIREIIKTAFDKVKIGQAGWEDGEDIITFNGSPVGGTITGHSREFDRWWPFVISELATIATNALLNKQPCETPQDKPTEASEIEYKALTLIERQEREKAIHINMVRKIKKR